MRTTLRRRLSTLGALALVTTFFTASPGASAEAGDTAYPVLNAVTMTKSTVTAGSSITAAIDATDDVGITSVSVRFDHTENYLYNASVKRPWRSDGLLSVPISLDAADGTYTLSSVTLWDASGKTAEYSALGRNLVLTPSVVTGPFTHSLDLPATRFTVTGGADRTAPRVTTISMPTRPTTAGTTARLELALDDAGPVTATAVWSNDAVMGEFASEAQQTAGGQVSLPFTMELAGTYRLTHVIVTDAGGNRRQYERNGTETSLGWRGAHTLDFPRFDFAQKPAAPDPLVTARPASVRVRLFAEGNTVSTQTGWRVFVNPGNIVSDVPMKSGITQMDLKGLVNGTTYTVSTVARSATGDSAATTRSVRPMPSTNVFAVADATGDKRVDVLARQPMTTTTSGRTYIYPTNGAGRWTSRQTGFGAEEENCARVAPGDIYIVGQSEVLCYGDTMIALNRDGSGTQLGSGGWSSMRFVDGGQDLTGDGWPDVVGVTAGGVMKIYRTGSSSRIVSTTTLGSGWNAYTAVFQVGDFSGDRKADLVALDTTGRLWLYAGNGRGGFSTRRQIGNGWGSFGSVLPLCDFNGDGRVDIGAITMDGKLLMYPGNGRGGFLTKSQIGNGWDIFF
jgi:hypothetical protein